MDLCCDVVVKLMSSIKNSNRNQCEKTAIVTFCWVSGLCNCLTTIESQLKSHETLKQNSIFRYINFQPFSLLFIINQPELFSGWRFKSSSGHYKQTKSNS